MPGPFRPRFSRRNSNIRTLRKWQAGAGPGGIAGRGAAVAATGEAGADAAGSGQLLGDPAGFAAGRALSFCARKPRHLRGFLCLWLAIHGGGGRARKARQIFFTALPSPQFALT